MADWTEREPGYAESAHEIQRVFRRARARPILTLAVAFAAVGLLVAAQAKKTPIYRARVILRITESALVGGGRLDKDDIRSYLAKVALSRDRLLAVIDEHGLYAARRARSPEEAIAAFRDALGVSVFQNYFLMQRSYEDQLRSVRVALSYMSMDPEEAVAVAESLAAAVTAFETERRREQGALEVERADRHLRDTVSALEERERALAELALRQASASLPDRARLQIEIDHIASSLEAHRILVEQARADKAALELSAAAEAQNLGMAIEVADIRRPEVAAGSRVTRLAALGVVAFLLVLPLAAIAVGAFDTRVYGVEDVERLGIPAVGHVPGFAGFCRGSLAERLGTTFWGRLRQ
jgi:hypothetical protein